MSQFEWQIDDDPSSGRPDPPAPPPPRRRLPRWPFWLVVAALLLGVGVGVRVRQDDRVRERALQRLLDLEQRALQAGDTELYLSTLTGDSAWRAAQLLPANQALVKAGQRVVEVVWFEWGIVAEVAWEEDGIEYRRVQFFQEVAPGAYRRVGALAAFWGRLHTVRTEWGTLTLHEADRRWEAALSTFIGDTMRAGCAADCPALHVVVAGDFGRIATPDTVRVPSPRLVALTPDGAPAQPFWDQLRQEVTAAVTPSAAITFAVPEEYAARYTMLAQAYTQRHPAVTVTITPFSADGADAATLLAAADGARLVPSVDVLASGAVADLTNLAYTDPDFAPGDFYEQIWAGTKWLDRVWLVPASGSLNVVYFDRESYRVVDRTPPSPGWTWDEMERDMDAFAELPDDHHLCATLIVGQPDLLYAYAYTLTDGPLTSSVVDEATAWFDELTQRPRGLVSLAELDPRERTRVYCNTVGYPRRAALWVDGPLLYEHYLQYDPLGVAPFPASDRFRSVSPLWVDGYVVSESAENPLAVWHWLSFLSRQAPEARFRVIPARPTVAAATQYWTNLPRPLSDVIRPAFASARAVTFEERFAFGW